MPRITITVPGDHPQAYQIPLDRSIVTIGRGQTNDITINSGSVSTQHAEMRLEDGKYSIVDSGSTNGLKIKGLLEEKILLSDGIIVKLGDAVFNFALSAEEGQQLAGELVKDSEGDGANQTGEQAESSDTTTKILQVGTASIPTLKPEAVSKAAAVVDEEIPETLPVVENDPELEIKETVPQKVSLKPASARQKKRAAGTIPTPPTPPVDTGSKKLKSDPRAPLVKRIPAPPKAGPAGSIMALLIFVGAFYAGMEIRHQKDGGGTLTNGIVNKGKIQETEAAKEEAEATPAAE